MNNSDFQRLLATDDKALVKELTSAPKKKNKRPIPEKFKGKGKGKDGEQRGGKGETGKGGIAPDQPEYRDRAQERRENKNEYERIAAEWENHAEVELEQSKYLGGDVEHTHLVKGLDFALLSKVRNELNKQARHEQLQEERQAKKLPKKRTFETALAKKVWHAAVETLHPHHKTFTQRLHGMSKAISMGQRIRGAPSVFLPGRMEYEFDVGASEGPSDIPRMIYISKDDAPAPDWSRKAANVLPDTVAKVRGSLQRAAEEKKRRKQEKSLGEKASYTVAQKVVVAPKIKAKDPDDDIFSGVGGFNGAEMAAKEALKKQQAQAKAHSKKDVPKKSYFDDAGDEKYQQRADDVQLSLDDVHVDEKSRGDGGTGGADENENNFKASRKWRGARPGWVFKTGPQGLGYYLDDPKLAARAEAAKADAAMLAGHSERTSLRRAKDSKEPSRAKRQIEEGADDDDAYGELFPSAMAGHALVMTGEDGSDEEDESAKKKIDKLKKLAQKDSVASSSYGKKGKASSDDKKRKMNENQQWQKIEHMIKKGKHSSLEELEASTARSRRNGPPAPREITATPAYF